jgi:glycosyltransferase involved in cell wall biosynthesis
LSTKTESEGGILVLRVVCVNPQRPAVQIALVTETFPPEVNGVALTLQRLVGGLVNRRHGVTVIRPRQKGEVSSGPRMHNATEGFEQWLVRGSPIPFYNSLRLGFPAGGMLRRRWQENRPDVVHIATEGPLGYSALKAAQSLGLPVSSSFHTNFQQYGGHYGMRFGRVLALRYLRWLHNRAACTLVPTEEMRARLARFKFERLTVLSRGVDARLFSPTKRSEALRKTWGVGPDDPAVIHVGRMAAEKNIELAVEAYQAIRLINPRMRFVLVGDGPLRESLEAKYPEFIYAGTRRDEDLAAHYASADLFLFPSVTETFGNVVTEALASGLVIVGYDYAAMRQHVRPGVNGFCVKLGDRAAFLQQACEAIHKRAEWPAIRAAARMTAQTISWDVIVTQFESQLAGLAQKK